MWCCHKKNLKYEAVSASESKQQMWAGTVRKKVLYMARKMLICII